MCEVPDFEDDFPFPKVGYVNPLGGMRFQHLFNFNHPSWSPWLPKDKDKGPAANGAEVLLTPGILANKNSTRWTDTYDPYKWSFISFFHPGLQINYNWGPWSHPYIIVIITLASGSPAAAPGAPPETALCRLTNWHAFGMWDWKGAYAPECNQGAKRANDVHEVPGTSEMLPQRLILHLLQAPKDDRPSVVWQPDRNVQV